MLAIESPLPLFVGLDGLPLDAGYIYFGTVNLNPVTSPVTVYWDAAGTQPVAQPVRTSSGLIVRNGTPASVYSSAGFSMLIKDSTGRQVHYARNSAEWQVSDYVDTLRADLANEASATKGTYIVGHRDSTSGEGMNLSAYLNLKVKGLKANFGAVGDGVTEDYAAVNAAFQTAGKIIEIEDATFLCGTGLTAPTCAGIVGRHQDLSIIKFDTGVTKGLPIVGAYPGEFRDFGIEGNATASARGLVVGDGSLTSNLRARGVNVFGWTGTGSIAADFRDAVGCAFDMCRFASSTQNMRIKTGAVSGTPTTLAFNGGFCELATAEGLLIESAYGVTFDDWFIFQTNGNEGVLVDPTSDNVLSLVFKDVWFEGNWYSLVADAVTRLTKYQLRSNGTGSTIQLEVHGGKFDSIAKSIEIASASNAGFLIDGTQVANIAGAITVSGGYGRIGVPANLSYATVVSDTGARAANIYASDGPFAAYTPTYASDLGDAATTFSGGTVTTTLARINNAGGTLINITVNASATLNAVTPNRIHVSLPSGVTSINNDTYGPCTIKVGATYETGIVRAAGSVLYFYRANFANFTSGAAIEILSSFCFEAS